jgi:phage-related minor tail protein
VQEREQMRELVQLVSQCIDQVEKMINVGTGMHSRLDAIKRTGEQDE